MALEMKVHRDIAAYVSKPMFGLTWRQIAALACMIFGGGALFAGTTTLLLATRGEDWTGPHLGWATTWAMYVMFIVILPAALWAWLRPMDLKPETYFQYFIRHQLTEKVTHYGDTLPQRSAATGDAQSVPGTAEQARRRRAKKNEARLRRTLSEHQEAQSPRSTRRTSRSTDEDRR